jgi:pyruvate dehydrogenase E2 component (dihydrolipoamide acetyltransferase)
VRERSCQIRGIARAKFAAVLLSEIRATPQSAGLGTHALTTRPDARGIVPHVPEVVMPRLSDSMEEGTILRWLKASGDEVKRGEELVEIETDKANMTYESDQAGVLEIVAQEGDTLPIGAVIARIGGGGEQAAERAVEEPVAVGAAAAAPSTPAPPPAAPRESAPAETSDGNGRVKASPVAKRMARELGLDLSGVAGTGPGGRIVKADVEALSRGDQPAAATTAPAAAPPPAAAAPPPPPPPAPVVAETGTAKGDVSREELTRTQQVVARRMAESRATIPDFTLTVEVDMAAAVAMRADLKAAVGDRPAPSFNDFVVKASALALREFPRANGSYKDGKFELYSRVNVGIAVAAENSLVVPTVFDADVKSLGQIAQDARALAERVRAGAITPPELSGGTFTVSNLGMFGIESFTAVINPPQSAILAVGAVRDTPVVANGEIVPGKRMSMTLCSDHRILYGADAAQFLTRIRQLLEHPAALAL